MSSFLPPVHSNVQQPQPHPHTSNNMPKAACLKLPSWDRVALINLEPLNPPSPYRPVVQKRSYPSVVSRIMRLTKLHDNTRKNFLVPTQRLSKTLDTSYEMMEGSEESSLLYLVKEELVERDTVVFIEQQQWTHLWVNYLQNTSILMEEDIYSAEEDARNVHEREEERGRKCLEIEMESTTQRIQKRMQDKLRNQIDQLMPFYRTESKSLMDEEAKEVSEILLWFKNKRPFGMRLPGFLLSEEQQRSRKKPIRRPFKNPIVKKTEKKYCGVKSVAFTRDTNPLSDPFLEASYLEEGREAWRLSKYLHFAQRKSSCSAEKLCEMEGIARAEIFAEEAMAWLSILAESLDEHREVQWSLQKRGKMEVEEEEVRLQELHKRETIFKKLEEAAAAKSREDVKDVYSNNPEISSMEYEGDGVLTKEQAARAGPSMQLYTLEPREVMDQSNEVCQDASISWDSESSNTTFHPMLNTVMGIALERDPYVALHNPTLSALAEAECALAACEGHSVGRAARTFAVARHIPFCPLYLVHSLWYKRPSLDDLCLKTLVDDNLLFRLSQFLKLELDEREELMDEQIVAIWSLYQEAAEHLSLVTGTDYGDVYYIGVHMLNDL